MSDFSKKLLIFGTGKLAELVAHYFQQSERYSVVGWVSLESGESASVRHLGPIIPMDELASFDPAEHVAFVALDSSMGSEIRAAWADRVSGMGYQLVSYVSTSADVPAALTVQPNTLIMEGAGLQPFVRIGRNTVIGLDTRIGFHTRICSHCWLSGAILGESVQVGERVYIGQNVTIAPFSTIGAGSVIGPGTVVTSSVQEGETRLTKGAVVSRVPSYRLRRL